ncbi:MAG: M20/M25/M40 family metallo-hydrolase [Vampirovibrionales bacterium]|nr:M20/M25/M40 family metallo-hydrolase [Vampirovibrionales bacterium]
MPLIPLLPILMPLIPIQDVSGGYSHIVVPKAPAAIERISQNNTPLPLSHKRTVTLSADQILKTFLDLVKIPSPSGQEAEVRAYVENRLQTLGIAETSTVEDFLSTPDKQYLVDPSGNLILKIPGNVSSNRTLLLNAHMDVVPPCLNIKPVIRQDKKLKGDKRVVHSSGDTVLGGDDKAALAPLLEALAYSLRLDNDTKRKHPRPNLLLTITVEEEIGGVGAGKIDPALYMPNGRKPEVAVSFDISGEQGTVVYEAPQLTIWNATVKGQSAHAGMEPEKGVNALKAAVLAASQIEVGRLDEDMSANIGTFNSGQKFNIIAEQAHLSGEVRSLHPEKVERQLEKIQRAFEKGTLAVKGSSFELSHHTPIWGYHSDLGLEAFAPLKQALKKTGLPLTPIRTNGASDVNVFAKKGIPSVVLSGAYYNPHQTSEFVRVEDMATLAQLMLNIWQCYASAP